MKQWYEELFENYGMKYDRENFARKEMGNILHAAAYLRELTGGESANAPPCFEMDVDANNDNGTREEKSKEL